MLFGKLLKLTSVRVVVLLFMLAQNLLVVRFSSLDEIGRFYLIATIAYLGNAILFVGFDSYLQQRLANLSVDSKISRNSLCRYIGITVIMGSFFVFLVSAIYFKTTENENWIFSSVICCGLSVGTYLSTLGRNLLQLAAHPMYSNLGPISDGLARSILLTIFALFYKINANNVVLISITGAALAAIVTFSLLYIVTRHIKDCYTSHPKQLFGYILPIGSGGLLHWIQVQSYRPVISVSEGGSQIVGALSFMTTLGSAAGNAAFSILAQLQVPRQYKTGGETTPEYLISAVLIGVILSIISIPFGFIFLWLTNKTQLLGVVYLIALGVIIETCNAVIGICNNHLLLIKKSLWHLPVVGFTGCTVTYFSLFSNKIVTDEYLRISISLILGLMTTLVMILYITYKYNCKK